LERACVTFSPSHFGHGKIIYANHLPWYNDHCMLADHKKNHAQVTRFCDKSLEISTWKIYGNLIKCKIWITLVNISPCQFLFQPFVTWLQENYDYRNVSWEMICIYDLTMSKMRGGERNTCSFQYWLVLSRFYILSSFHRFFKWKFLMTCHKT
jgi:hypothetical protein